MQIDKKIKNIKRDEMKDDSSFVFDLEHQMIHHLMLKSAFIRNVSLLHGKMGIALFFYHYSQYKNNSVYEDFAGNLLDDVWKETHHELPIGFAFGLTGIAWGIEYLIQNGFVSGNSNAICAEIDKKIMNTDIRRLNAEFLENELDGFLHYVLIRITGSIKQQTNLPFDELYRSDLAHVLNVEQTNTKVTDLSRKMINQFLHFTAGKQTLNYELNLFPFVEAKEINEENLLLSPLGLQTGLAGYLYKQLKRQMQ